MKFQGKESSRLEFKEQLPKSGQIINTIIAFCNMHGGKLVVGVSDSSEIIGLSEKDAHEAMEWLNESIYSSCAPPILPQIYQQNIDGKYLVVIDVSSGMQKPYYKKSLGLDKGTFIRLGRSTVKANADLIEELKLQARGKSYDQTPVHHASMDDLDLKKSASFLQERRNGAKVVVTDEVLKAYEIILEQHSQIYPSVCGILLFGKEPQRFMTESYILCSHFSGIKGREAIATKACIGTLYEQFDLAYDFILSRLNKSYTIKGKRREEIYEIPPVAIREVVMNALLHRNYNLKAPIKISIYDNRIEVFSPGVFPGPIDVEQLDSGITYTRNIAVAKILWEFGYVEKMGSGFFTIFESYREAGLATPDIIEGSNYVKCMLYRERRTDAQQDDASRILGLFNRFDEISRSDIVEQLQIPKSTAGRILGELVTSGKLVRLGGGRNTRYIRSE